MSTPEALLALFADEARDYLNSQVTHLARSDGTAGVLVAAAGAVAAFASGPAVLVALLGAVAALIALCLRPIEPDLRAIQTRAALTGADAEAVVGELAARRLEDAATNANTNDRKWGLIYGATVLLIVAVLLIGLDIGT